MTAPVEQAETSSAQQTSKPAQPTRVTLAIALSVVALVISGVSFAGWMQASEERQQIENRLLCLELPGPNDCGQDAE